jgi:formimidoylglutamate deiminase
LTIDITTAALHGLNNDELLDGWIFSSADTVSDLYSAGRHIVEDGRHVARAVVEARFRQAIDALAANA